MKRLHDLVQTNGHPDSQLEKGILDARALPDDSFEALWEAIILDNEIKDRLLSQAILNFTLRGHFDRASVPLHGIILLVGPPGTGKTSLARGLASRIAKCISRSDFQFIEVEPHALASKSLGKSQQAVRDLLGTVIAERASYGPVVVLLDEVETLAADRSKLSLEANPVDVHRATDAVLAQLDQLAVKFPDLLFVATSNFPEAIDSAFLSRADQIVTIDLPNTDACQKILADTLTALASKFHKIEKLVHSRELSHLAKNCVGLDGRQIRKAVLSALTFDKATAVDPNKLSTNDVAMAIELAKHEAGRAK